MSLLGLIKKSFTPLGSIVGGKAGKLINDAALIGAGIISGNPQLVLAGVADAASRLQKKPKVPSSATDRLRLSLDPTTPRKFVLGQTAMAADVRYQAPTGANQEYIQQIVVVAAHQVEEIAELWFDNEKAWTKAGGAQGRLAGYLTVTDRLVGTASNGIAIDSVWTASSRLTGCAYLHIVYKLTGNSKKAESPFSTAIPTRVTIRGKGARVYDPALDSTVAGGSGPQRANDQTTWAFSSSRAGAGRNPALQLLWYFLGWRIQNPSTSAWKLSVGRGIPAARLDLPSFLAAAAVCDEAVALAAGGTEPRYRSDGVFSEDDDPSTVVRNLLAAMNGYLDDTGGKISLNLYKNDLASPALTLTEADILGDELWEPVGEIRETFNRVRGRYVDASDNALYQLAEYPEVALASPDGIERIESIDFPLVQSASQVQRLAKTWLQRNQYQGRYSVTIGPRGWKLTRGRIVAFSHQGLGWSNKLFRVVAIGFTTTGATRLVLQEENAAIYAWAAEETAPVVAAAPTVYDPLNAPTLLGIAEAAYKTYRQVSDPALTNTIRDNDRWVELVSPMREWVRIGGSWQTAANYVASGSDIGVANGATKNRTFYGSSDPAANPANGVGDGDKWIDATVVPNLYKERLGGTWVNASNLITGAADVGVADGATSDLKLTSIGSTSVALVGNSVRRNSGANDYGPAVRGEPMAGGCFAEVDIASGDAFTSLFFHGDAATYNQATANLLFLFQYNPATGLCYLVNNGTLLINGGPIASGLAGKMRITYDGVRFRAFIGGTQYGPDAAAAANLTLWPKWHAWTAGVTYTGLRSGPLTSNDLGDKGGKLPKVTNLPNALALNLGYKFTGAISYSAAAGTPATATISVGAGSIIAGDTLINYNAMSANVSGTGGTTVPFFLVGDDPNNAGGSLTLIATSNGSSVYQGNGRVFFGSIEIAFPASGSGTGTGYGGGGAGYTGGGGTTGRTAIP